MNSHAPYLLKRLLAKVLNSIYFVLDTQFTTHFVTLSLHTGCVIIQALDLPKKALRKTYYVFLFTV